MKLKAMVKWNVAVSVVYAMGVWAAISSFAYFEYTGKLDKAHPEMEENRPEKEKNPQEKVYETPYAKTVIVYKKDFVPYSTRISNFFASFGSSPQKGDK